LTRTTNHRGGPVRFGRKLTILEKGPAAGKFAFLTVNLTTEGGDWREPREPAHKKKKWPIL